MSMFHPQFPQQQQHNGYDPFKAPFFPDYDVLYSQSSQPSLPSTASNISTPISVVGGVGCTPSPPSGAVNLAPTRAISSTKGPTILGSSTHSLTHMGDTTPQHEQMFGDADLADALELISEDSMRMERGGGKDPMIGGTPLPAQMGVYSNSPHRIDVSSPYSDLPSLPPPSQPLSHLPKPMPPTSDFFSSQSPSMVSRYPSQTPFMTPTQSVLPLQSQGMGISQLGRSQVNQGMNRPVINPFANPVNPQMRLSHFPMANVKVETLEPSSSPRPREFTYAVVSTQQQGPLHPHTAANIPTTSSSSPINISATSPGYMVASPQAYLAHWAQIMYYELDERVGETYKPTIDQITVDGFTSTIEPNRLCLGAISNARRNPAVLAVRRQIGRGIQLTRSDGVVRLECNSDSPVFVQSPVHAHHMGENLATIYRIAKNHSIEIFNEQAFEEMLNEARKSYKRTYQMQNMCQARVSFVKGFGAEYRRQTIQMTPCWIEIHFQDPLQRIDKILRSFQDHEGFASSFS
ncbi:unnamed protein product, partial [Mesorhabditis belari]|uniref:MH2 domain-containing protein n=1 Tax=Mesorhabditis belari TaxID=2138241 RepID=A0AAF3EM21_9BILA